MKKKFYFRVLLVCFVVFSNFAWAVTDKEIIELGKDYVLRIAQKHGGNNKISIDNLDFYTDFDKSNKNIKYYDFIGEISGLKMSSNEQSGMLEFTLVIEREPDHIINRVKEKILIFKKEGDRIPYKVNHFKSSKVKILTQSGLSKEMQELKLKEYIKSNYPSTLNIEIKNINSTLYAIEKANSSVEYTAVTDSKIINGRVQFAATEKVTKESDKFQLNSNSWFIRPRSAQEIPFPNEKELIKLLNKPLYSKVKEIFFKSNDSSLANEPNEFFSKIETLSAEPVNAINNRVNFKISGLYKLGLPLRYRKYNLRYKVSLEYDYSEEKWKLISDNLEIKEYQKI